MRDLGFGKNLMEERILSEVTELLEYFHQQDGRPCNPGESLYFSVSNIICLFLFGKRFSSNDTRFLGILQKIRDMMRNFMELMLVQFIPFVRYLPWAKRGLKKQKEDVKVIFQFINDEIGELAKLQGPADHPENFVAAYKHKMAGTLDHKLLSHIALDFFAAGTDTTATALRWALIYMANNPAIQSRGQRIIDEVIGQGRLPSMSDRSSLGYVEAIILETLRTSSVTPLGTPHRLSVDTKLHGFNLKEGTVVRHNTVISLRHYDLHSTGNTSQGFH